MAAQISMAVPDWPVFLCYRQQDGRETADWLYEKLHKQPIVVGGRAMAHLEVYLDRRAPAAHDWRAIHLPALQRARSLVVIITPGLRAVLDDDWVHRELDWWLRHRRAAPILVDTTGHGQRWTPEKITARWPRAQRVEVKLADWARLGTAGAVALGDAELTRIRDGIRISEQEVAYQDLERQRRMVRRLMRALVVAFIAIVSFGVMSVVAIQARNQLAAATKRFNRERFDTELPFVTQTMLEANERVKSKDTVARAAEAYRTCERLLELALEADPANAEIRERRADAQNGLAWAYLLEGRPQDAMTHASQAAESAPGQLDILINLAHSYIFNGRTEDARRIYEQYKDAQLPDNYFGEKTFARQVRRDFKQFRDWKLTNATIEAAMSEIEKDLGRQ
jgi:tetratricopeptide (TPR) repeat protein